VSAAITAARTALAAPVLDEPEEPGTQPLAAVPAPRDGADRPRADQPGPGLASPAGRPALRRQSLFRGATRSLFVTPWFAAATGFVIAAGLWVYSPHTELRFPSSAPGVSLCPSKGCGQQPRQTGPKVTTVTPGHQLQTPEARKKTSPARASVNQDSTAADGLTFKFTVLWQRNHGFGATVTVAGHKVPSSWRLSFELAGTQIEYVMGVAWTSNPAGNGGTASQPSGQAGGTDGDYLGTATAFGGGTGDGGGQPGVDGAQNDPGTLPVISFLITGSGPAGAPSHCEFDGASCTFR
jgi:hypothetical protein